MTWLVTGGAGYIGAHIVDALTQRGEEVVVLDDLSTGSADRVVGATLVEGSVLDRELVANTLGDHRVRGVIHIAAKKQVGESVADPLLYYRENVGGLESLLAAMVRTGVDRMVFSSSAATYGMPDVQVITEDTPTRPINPYGESKLIGEWMMAAAAVAYGLRYVSLRYFNVAGAARPELGDPGVFNLIPLAFAALDSGRPARIFGDDWPTPDGTCIRDYVHVADIADAHVEALLHLDRDDCRETFNVGTGTGSSVAEVLAVVRSVTGIDADPVVVPRRAGDPAALVANVDRIGERLGWHSRLGLEDMVRSAWEGWVLRHPRSGAPT